MNLLPQGTVKHDDLAIIRPMLKAVLYWIVMALAALVIGPAAGALVGNLRAADGAGHVTPLTSVGPVVGMGAGLAALALAVLTSLACARFLGIRAAMTVAGIIAAWTAIRTAMPDDLVIRAQGTGVLVPLAVEGLIFGILAAVGAGLLLRAGEHGQKDVSPLLGPEGLKAIGIGALVAVPIGGVIVYVVAFETLKLQTVFSASFAGIGAGAVAALACSAVSPDRSAARATIGAFLGMAILATIGPVSALAINSAPGALLRSAYGGTYFPLAAPLAFDWIAGAFLGVPVGIGWAGSMLDKSPASAK